LKKKKQKIESATAKPEVMGRPEMADKERQAVVKDRRTIPARSGYQVTHPVRVCRHNEGKAGRESSRKAVC
jgi:hypothetical protein